MFARPCIGRVTSPFGWRTHPVTGVRQSWHQGVDLARAGNIPIYAAADGTVTRVGALGTYGNVVMIVHNIGGKTYETNYAHLKSYSVKVGQKVKQGQRIAYMGTTGQSTGQHLHFEIHVGRWATGQPNAVDPMKYITTVPALGAIGSDVEEVQRFLNNHGYKLTVDGHFGSGTDKALKDFQRNNKLSVDGKSGPATLAKLKEPVAPASSTPSPTPPKEGTTMPNLYKPSASATVNSTATVLRRLEQKENQPLDPQWRQKLLDGTLTVSDAIGLIYVAIDRGHIVGK